MFNCCIQGYTDTSDPGQFGPKAFRHHQTGTVGSRHFGTSAEVSRRQFDTGAKISRLSSDILLIYYSRTMYFSINDCIRPYRIKVYFLRESLDHTIANAGSVCPDHLSIHLSVCLSVCYTRDPHLNGSRY